MPDLDAERLLEEAERALKHTSSFLEHLHESDAATRRYIEQVKEKLENDLRRRRERDTH